MKINEILSEAMQYIVKSKDGREKVFSDHQSPAALAWKNSTKKQTPKQAAKASMRSASAKPAKIDDNRIALKVYEVVGNCFPDADPFDFLYPWLIKNGLDYTDVNRAMRKEGYRQGIEGYWKQLEKDHPDLVRGTHFYGDPEPVKESASPATDKKNYKIIPSKDHKGKDCFKVEYKNKPALGSRIFKTKEDAKTAIDKTTTVMESWNQGSSEAAKNAISNRIIHSHTDLFGKYGLDAVVAAIDEVSENLTNLEEIGSSDVSGWVKQVIRNLAEDFR